VHVDGTYFIVHLRFCQYIGSWNHNKTKKKKKRKKNKSNDDDEDNDDSINNNKDGTFYFILLLSRSLFEIKSRMMTVRMTDGYMKGGTKRGKKNRRMHSHPQNRRVARKNSRDPSLRSLPRILCAARSV
jgi:hypothetical protein